MDGVIGLVRPSTSAIRLTRLRAARPRTYRQRKRPDGPYILSDIFPYESVSAGYAPQERAVLIQNRYAEPIDLQFGHILNFIESDPTTDSAVPIPEVVNRVGIIKGEHRRAVAVVGKPFGRPPGNALRRRIRGNEIRELFLERFQAY